MMRRATVSGCANSRWSRLVSIGAALPPADVAKAYRVPVDALSSTVKPSLVKWTQIDVVARERFALLTSTATKAPLTSIAATVAANPPKASPAKGLLTTKDFKSVEELVTSYEQVMYQVRVAKKEFDVLELQSFSIKDDLKRGLSAFKQAHLDKEKARLEIIKKGMQEKRQTIRAVGADYFTTAIFNDVINILRIAGEGSEDARMMALRVFDDMSLLEVPFDACTQLMLKNITFGDGPFEDSSLLFSCVEYPERGEISIAGDRPLEQIADAALNTISQRHQTPLDEGALIRQNDTHPCLQRSSE